MYTESFKRAVTRLMLAEDPSGKGVVTVDAGGVTKWGISKRANPDLEIEKLTRDEAIAVYWERYWTIQLCDDLPDVVASQWFLFAVNVDPVVARKLLQRALRACGYVLAEDGFIGPVSRRAIWRAEPSALCTALRCEYAGWVRLLAQLNPAVHGPNLEGWLRRAYEW